MALTKRTYTPKRTRITAKNLNEIQDELIRQDNYDGLHFEELMTAVNALIQGVNINAKDKSITINDITTIDTDLVNKIEAKAISDVDLLATYKFIDGINTGLYNNKDSDGNLYFDINFWNAYIESQTDYVSKCPFSKINDCKADTLTDTIDNTVTYADSIARLQGKPIYYDEFWDIYQDNGNRTNYSNGFFSISRFINVPSKDPTGLFTPKYQINPVNAPYIFSNCKFTDLNGITVDFSNCIDARRAFLDCTNLVALPPLNLSKCRKALKMFKNAPNIETVTFIGPFLCDIDLSEQTKLNKTSITSFVKALPDDVTDKSFKLSKTAIDNAFETSEGAANGSTSEEWTSLLNSSNITIIE